MPDSQAIPIPQGLDLCGSIADQTLFVQLLNLNFNLVVKVIEEQQSISLTLPGVPSMLIPGFPGIQIPGLSPFDIGIQAERQSLETAWIGNRILRGVPYDKRRATGRYGGTQGVKVGGTDLSIPGSDPFTVTMQYVELNFQIITQLVPSITTLPMLLPGAPGSLCSLPPEVRQPFIDQIISIINTQFEQVIAGGGGGGACTVNPADYTNPACYVQFFNPVTSTITLGVDSVLIEYSGVGGVFGGEVDGYSSGAFPGSTNAGCAVPLGSCLDPMVVEYDLAIDAGSDPANSLDSLVASLVEMSDDQTSIGTHDYRTEGAQALSAVATGHFISAPFSLLVGANFVAFNFAAQSFFVNASNSVSIQISGIVLRPA